MQSLYILQNDHHSKSLTVTIQLTVGPAPSVEDCSLPIELFWSPCRKAVYCKYVGVVWALNPIPLICMSVLRPLPVYYSSFAVSFEMGTYES